MSIRSQLSGFFGVLLAFILFLPLHIHAQDSAGIGLTPATVEDSADPGQQFREQLTISNLSDSDQEYYIFARNIQGVRDGGVPIFAPEDQEETEFDMTSWITLPTEQPIRVPAGGSHSFELLVDVPESATPGSHFAGIFISVEPPRLRSIGASVGYEVATIVSLRVRGEAIESASIREFSTDKSIYGKAEVDFSLRLENKGTVLVRPYGPLEITNMFGKRVELLTANESLAGVFPGTTRDFDIAWVSEDIGFGKYTAELGMIYGGEEGQRSITAETSFWVLPTNIVVPALLGILAIFIVVYVGVRLYVRSTIKRLSGGRVGKISRQRRRQSGPMSPGVLVLVVFLSVTALFLLILLVLFA